MPSTKYTPLVCEQPKHETMDFTSTAIKSEEISRCHNHVCVNGESQVEHRKCHKSRLRRFILPTALAALVILAGLFAFSCSQGYASGWGLNELFSRGVNGTSSSPFVKNKLYLIVLLVGLVVVIGLGIALSFWCCKGAFQNPLCCPCYLCACCGGLVCLECIGCGLCAEAVEQV